MASSFTYATLKTAIKNHIEDQGTDFDANVDTLIKLGEDQICKDMPLSMFEARANVSLTSGSQLATKPAGCIVAHELSFTSAGLTVILYPKRYSALRALVTNTTQAQAKWFADDYSETQFWIAPNPNLSVTAEALMTKRPTSIVDAGSSWFGSNVGDLLLHACLIASEKYGMADERLPMWRKEYGTLLGPALVQFAHLIRVPYMGEK